MKGEDALHKALLVANQVHTKLKQGIE